MIFPWPWRVAGLLSISLLGARTEDRTIEKAPIDSLIATLPAGLARSPEPARDADNGWIEFLKALNDFKSTGPKIAALREMDAANWNTDDVSLLDGVFARDKGTFERVRRAADKKALAVVGTAGGGRYAKLAEAYDDPKKLDELTKRETAQALVLILNGKRDEGVRQLAGGATMYLRLAASGGPARFYEAHQSALRLFLRRMRQAAKLPVVRGDDLAALLQALPETAKRDTDYRKVVIDDLFEHGLPALAETETVGQVLQCVDGEEPAKGPDPNDAIVLAFTQPKAPVDKIATAKLMGEGALEILKAIDLPWVADASFPHAVPDAEAAGAYPADVLTIEASERHIKDDDKSGFVSRLAALANPLGRLMSPAYLDDLVEGRKASLATLATVALTRACLAVHIYRRKHHDLPDTLELLVKDGILKAIPIDPFDDNPVHYSKERGILWSVGPDGKDDDGDSSFQHPAQEGGPPGAPKDIVVTLNPSPAP